MNGIVLIDKPAGLTSAEVVRRVKTCSAVKVGHLGTLDPFATGLLPLCVGEGTKIAQFLSGADKRYMGEIQLGTSTDTGDCTGTPIASAAVPALRCDDLLEIARQLSGERLQTPPMYSAIKRSGVPLYRLARRGIEVERNPRHIRIDHLTLRAVTAERLHFVVQCSKGTYIRVLAEEIGRAVGSLAHLAMLRRTAFGRFRIEDAASLDAWERVPGASASGGGFVSVGDAVAHLSAFTVDGDMAVAAAQGKTSVLRAIPPILESPTVLVTRDRAVVAIVVRDASRWHYARVFTGGAALHVPTPVVATKVK